MNQRPVHPELPEKPTVTPEAKRRTAGGMPVFIILTRMTGEPCIIATNSIVAIDPEEDENAPNQEHNGFDPDCGCAECKPQIVCPECGEIHNKGWYQTRITLNLIDEQWFPDDEVPAHFPLSRLVRETTLEIAKLLKAVAITG